MGSPAAALMAGTEPGLKYIRAGSHTNPGPGKDGPVESYGAIPRETECVRMRRFIHSLLLVAFVAIIAGCVTGTTPGETGFLTEPGSYL